MLSKFLLTYSNICYYSGYDLPPSKKTGQSSKSFRYFLESTQEIPSSKIKQENKSKKNNRKRRKIVTDNEEDTKPEKNLRYKKEKGESNPSFLARVELETNQKLIKAQKKVAGSSDRRKRYKR